MTEIDSTPTIPTKKCTGPCGRELPATAEYFYRQKSGKYGLHSKCKECSKAYHTTYHAAHREERAIYHSNYRTEHREQLAAQNATYYREHKEEKAAYKSAWYAAHKGEILARYASRAEEIKVRQTAYLASPSWKLKRKASRQRRRARNKAGGSYTTAELEAVLAAHTDSKGRLRCALCGEEIVGAYHIDHFIPLRQGGTNTAGNIRITHPICNLKKGAKHPHDTGHLI